MHYRKGSHSTDPGNKITIQTLDPNMQEVILTLFVTPPLNKVQKPEQSATYNLKFILKDVVHNDSKIYPTLFRKFIFRLLASKEKSVEGTFNW